MAVPYGCVQTPNETRRSSSGADAEGGHVRTTDSERDKLDLEYRGSGSDKDVIDSAAIRGGRAVEGRGAWNRGAGPCSIRAKRAEGGKVKLTGHYLEGSDWHTVSVHRGMGGP